MGSFRSKLCNSNDRDAFDASLDVSMDGLPDLAFEQILSHLVLKDRLRCMAVSRGWRRRFQSIEVKTLCFSGTSRGRIYGKNRLLSGAFDANFINSHRFASFFKAYRESVLSKLKHLRLCDLKLKPKNGKAFAPTLNSFDQLEQLNIIRLGFSQSDGRRKRGDDPPKCAAVIELHLHKLETIHLEDLEGIGQLTLDAQRLKRVKLKNCASLRLLLVHNESVEALLCNRHLDSTPIALSGLKNLKYLDCQSVSRFDSIDSTLLSHLKQLKEIHLHYVYQVKRLFFQRKAYGRDDLAIYYRGLLLDRPDDRRISALDKFNTKSCVHLAQSMSTLADEISFRGSLFYRQVDAVEPELTRDLLKKFTDLHKFRLERPVMDEERFLGILQNFDNIVHLKIDAAQPQCLFEQLPDRSAIQKLEIRNELLGLSLDFLLRLKHLICFTVEDSIDAEWIFKAFEELPFLTTFGFSSSWKQIQIKKHCPKLFKVSIMYSKKIVAKTANVPTLDLAIPFIRQNTGWTG